MNRRFRGLIDNARLRAGFIVQFIARGFLQSDEASCQRKRVARFRTEGKIAIEIGSSECDNQKPRRMRAPEPVNGGVTAPRVQRDQQIAIFPAPLRRDRSLVSKIPEYLSPAVRGNTVSQCRILRLWRDDKDSHDSNAQVRNPAQISRRSDV